MAAETNNTPQTTVTSAKPDWFVNNLQGAIPTTLNEMHAQGDFANNFSIEEPDTYWNKKTIQDAFKDQQGNLRKDLFDESYKKSLSAYKTHRDTEMNLVNFISPPNITAARSGINTPAPLIFKANEDPLGRNYQSGYAFTDGFTKAQRSMKETAIATGVRQDDGSYINPKDFSGDAKFAMGDKGGLLLNEEGKPYLIPVKDGEQLHGWDQVYSKTADSLGNYEAEYGLQNFAASFVKNPINFASQSVDDLIEYGRGFLNFWGLDTKGSDRALNNVENAAKSWKQGGSEENEGDFYNLESIVDMSQQVVYQLGSMAAVGATIMALTKNPTLASRGSKLFMAALSAGAMAEVARDNGLSKRESAVLLGVTTAALYPIMSLSEATLGKLATKESRAALTETIKNATKGGVLIKEAAKSGSKASLRTIFSNLKEGGKSWVFRTEKSAPLVVGVVSETLEETTEQAVDLAVRGGYNAYSYTADEGKHPFQIDWSDELAKMGQAATGGAIGGGIAHGLMQRISKSHPEVAHQMQDMVLNGKGDVIRDFINQMHAQGRLDHNWITSDGKMTTPEKGNSKNDEAKNVLTGLVDYMEELRDSTGVQDTLKNNKEAATSLFSDVIESSSVGKDANDLTAKINSLSSDLEKAKASATPNTEYISSLQKQLAENQDALQKIITGDFVYDYINEGTYEHLSRVTNDPSFQAENLSGKEFVSLMNALPGGFSESQQKGQAAIDTQTSLDTAATTDAPEGASEERVLQLADEAKSDYNTQHEAFKPYLEAIAARTDEAGEQLLFSQNLNPDASPETRTEEISVLKNLIPSLEGVEKDSAQKIVDSADKLGKVEKTKGVKKPELPPPAEQLLLMTEGKGRTMMSSPSSIPQKIEEEEALKKAQVVNGVSMYTNTDQLVKIKNSINHRLAQTKAIIALRTKLEAIAGRFSKPALPPFKPEELISTVDSLNKMLGVVNNLIAESVENATSADTKIAQATSSLLGKSMDYLNNLAELAIGTEFEGIQKIVASRRDAISKAIEGANIQDALKLFNDTETQIYNEFGNKKEAILAVLTAQEFTEFSKRSYDYARGVLSLSSSDFWNAYHSVLINSNAAIFSPTDEHSILVKQAVQGLMADAYNPPTSSHPNEVLHHNSLFVEGRGGTAKTKTMIPLIAGVMQTLVGGKVFLTAAQDAGDYKRGTLMTAVENFFRISDKQLGIQLKSSTLPMLDFMNSVKEANEVIDGKTVTNLVVFDEGTLLSTADLALVQSRLNKMNKQRAELGYPLMKVLYTGDTVQNSLGVDKANPDSRAIGIDDTNRHVMQRTPALTFSFRSSNQQLSLFSSYLENIQKEKGTSRPFNTEYSSREGVQIQQNYEEFISNATSYVNSLTKQQRLHEAVYITDKGKFSIDQRILDSGILVMTSEEAQGREWPIVFFDPINTTLFVPSFNNIGVKKDYYTAATRASSYLLTHVSPGQGITSAEGTVNKIRPLTPENVTRPATIEKVAAILGSHSAPVSSVAFDYTKVTIAKEDNIFDESPTNSLTGQQFTADSKLVSSTPVVNGNTVKSTSQLTDGSSIVDYLTASNREGLVTLHSFFTNELHSTDEQMALKRKALFDLKARKTIPYFLSINRIGSPGYDNVIRNNPEFKGSYALFIEAGPSRNNVILGTLSSPGLDKAIAEGNLLQGRESARIPLSSDFLSEMENTGVTVFNKKHQVKTLAETKKASPGVRFGTPYIVTISRAELNVKGQSRAKGGEIFIPGSFFYTEAEIARVLKANNSSAYITKIPFRTKYLQFKEIVNNLDKYIQNDKFSFGSDNGLSGRLYDVFWSHNAESHTDADGNSKPSRLSAAFQEIQSKIPQTDPFYKFLEYYIERGESTDALIKQLRKLDDTKEVTSNMSRYFLKHYLETKAKGQTKKLINFERAVTMLSTHPYFRKGFEFNPRILYGSTSKSTTVHAQARQLPDDIYEKYLEAELDYVSPPELRIPLNHLKSAIQESIAAPQTEQNPTTKRDEKAPAPTSEDELISDGEETTHLGQSPVESVPTASVSEAGPSTQNDVVADDRQSERYYDEDSADPDPSNVLTLSRLQETWFSKPGYSTMLPRVVTTFKRTFMNGIFSLNAEDGAKPYLRDINDVIKDLRRRATDFKKSFTPEFMDGLDPVSNEADRDQYIKGVMIREFDFLLSKYFPTVYQDADTKQWKYRSKHHKQRSFSEKESFNLLAEGMTDMVKTQLYNTPVIRRMDNGTWVSSGDFIWEGDIETLVNIVSGVTSNEEISQKLVQSGNQAAMSLYMRLLNKDPYTLDGKQVWSIGAVQNPETFKMRDSVLQFLASGQVLDLTKVNLDEQKLRAPWSVWGSPNTSREISRQSVAQVAENQGKYIVIESNGSAILGALTVNPSNVAPSTDQHVLDAIHAIGLTSFAMGDLKVMQELDFGKLNVIPTGNIAQKVNDAIIDQIILPTMVKMSKENFISASFRRLNILYDSIIRSSSSPNVLMDLNVDGNKRYRLQWGSPIYNINTQIEDIKADITSPSIDNLIVKGQYVVEKTPIKSGFQSWKSSKSVSGMSENEIADFDVIWSFAQMLKETHSDSGKFDVAMMTPMVWSDSPTDPQMIVRVDKGYFRAPVSIVTDLFQSRRSFYARQSGKILTAWNEILGPGNTVTTLQALKSKIAEMKVPLSVVESHPGMVDNLYYVKSGDTVTIKQSLIDDVEFYTGNNQKAFIARANAHFAELLQFSNSSKDMDERSMTERLGKVIEGKSGTDVLKAFYYNWLAFSGELANMTTGPLQQYKDKGKGETDEFIDSVKRNKLVMTNRSSMLYRNKSWRHFWRQSKEQGIPMTEELKYEGRKLPQIGKIAYVKDIKQLLQLPSGLKKNQELYDGATFVFPTTRIMQKASNSGSHGMYVGAVMKNLTTVLNNSKGVTTYIKNAEYLLTPELMRIGTPRLINLVKRGYMNPFSSPIQGEGKVLFTPLDYLYSKGLSEDLSNAEWSMFEDLMDFLVENGEQDSLILEVAPDSSVKTGRGATNSFDPIIEGGNPRPYVTEDYEQIHKGTQLDMSHGIDEIGNVSGSQIINAMAVNWPAQAQNLRMLNGLAEIAYTKINEWKSKSPQQKIDSLKAIATNAFAKREDTSYASRLTAPSNSNNFSIDDRQVITPIIRGLTAELTDDAVLLNFEGGNFVVHPTAGLVQVYDVQRDGKSVTVMKSELLPEEKETAVGRDLKWDSGNGQAEILLPASMRKKFGIKPGTKLSEITPEYFATLNPAKARKASRMFKDFQKTLDHLVTRIPATGKHSAVSAKIIGFMEESENSVFVPAELLFVQGADQDGDKGVNFTQEVVNGLVPEVDGAYELKNKNDFPDKLRKKARIAGIKNAVVTAMKEILTMPATEVERNMTVDNAKEELIALAAEVEASYTFKRDSYVSYLKMRDINQAGMTLRGIFSNSMKAYQVMTAAYRVKGTDPASVGLSTDVLISERLGALVNAAVDNAKDQLLGNLGIGTHNANMVAYMVMKGMSFRQIHDQIKKYAPQMEQVKNYSRYDSRETFRASLIWADHPELASLNYLGNEISRIATLTLNRSIPSSDVDLIGYRKSAESFINGQYKSMNQTTDFRLIAFLENDEYATQQIEKYAKLRGKKTQAGQITRSEFNVLQILRDAPHIKAYMQVYLLAHNLASESKLYKVSSRLADEVMTPTSQLNDKNARVLAQLKDFTYGLFIDQYLQTAENPTDYDLTTMPGRRQFVESMDNKFVNTLKVKYPTNSFVDSLTITADVKRGWKDSSLLRLPDIQQMSEEKRMQLQADFTSLESVDKKTMVLYNLVVRHGKFGKDSFGALFSPEDKADFNRYLDKVMDISAYDYGDLTKKFNDYREAKTEETGAIHNAIPYHVEVPGLAVGTTALAVSEPAAPSATISAETAKRLSNMFDGTMKFSVKTPIERVLQVVDTLLSMGATNPEETVYLQALKQQIINRTSPDSKTVDEQAKGCAPK